MGVLEEQHEGLSEVGREILDMAEKFRTMAVDAMEMNANLRQASSSLISSTSSLAMHGPDGPRGTRLADAFNDDVEALRTGHNNLQSKVDEIGELSAALHCKAMWLLEKSDRAANAIKDECEI
jgi:formyltetrahydrofolate synthetase